MEYDTRPWDEYWILEDAESHKVKRIEVQYGIYLEEDNILRIEDNYSRI